MAHTIEEEVLKALRTVHDPDLKRDLVSLNMIKDLSVQDGNASFRVVLTTPACPLKAKIEADCRNAVSAIPGIRNITIKIDAEVQPKRAGGVQGGNLIEGVSHTIAVS